MNLAVILSNRCNLLCSYCAVLLNEGPTHVLEGKRLRRGIDLYLDGAPGEKRVVTYLGGEPLLYIDSLRETILHVRKRSPACRQSLYTNGVLLTREILEFLHKNDVDLVLSLDGRREDNDRFRVAYKNPAKSTWDAVMARLEGLPLDRVHVNMVFTPETAAGLVENVEFMRKKGFTRVEAGPDVSDVRRLAAWGPAPLASLRKASLELAAVLKSLPKEEAAGFEFEPFLPGSSRPEGEREFEALVLGADGGFYPCETRLGRPYEEQAALRLGGVDDGIDWAKQAAVTAEARAFVAKAFPGRVFFSCPLKVFVYAKHAGEDPAPLIQGTAEIFEAFHRPDARP